MKREIKIALIAVLAVLLVSLVIANSSHPTSPLFFGIRRLEEKAFYSLKMSPSSKADYLSMLLDERLADLEEEVRLADYSKILSSSLRYSTTAGDLTNMIIDNQLNDKAADLVSKFNSHKQRLQKIYEIYPKDIPDNVEWKYIQDDMNYLDLYTEKLGDSFKLSPG